MEPIRNAKSYVVIILLSFISIILIPRCTIDDQKATYRNILEFSDNIKVINTHEGEGYNRLWKSKNIPLE